MKVPASLEEAYRNTLYCAQGMSLQVGQKHPVMDIFLDRYAETYWCFVTAYNPYSQAYPRAENTHRNAQLKNMLLLQGYTKIFYGEGRGIIGNWPPEASFLVLGISRCAAQKVGKSFQQNAIVWGEKGREAELVFLV